MEKYIVVLSDNTSNALYKRKTTGLERKNILIVDQMWKGDIYLADFDDLDKAEEYAEAI